MNTKHIGDISEYKVITKLLELGYSIAKPIGDNSRYDLLIDFENKFYRVQTKTGRLKNGVINLYAKSLQYDKETGTNGTMRRNYKGEIEYFAVYCPELDKVYIVPIDHVKKGTIYLRVNPTINNQTKCKINWAKDYELA